MAEMRNRESGLLRPQPGPVAMEQAGGEDLDINMPMDLTEDDMDEGGATTPRPGDAPQPQAHQENEKPPDTDEAEKTEDATDQAEN